MNYWWLTFAHFGSPKNIYSTHFPSRAHKQVRCYNSHWSQVKCLNLIYIRSYDSACCSIIIINIFGENVYRKVFELLFYQHTRTHVRYVHWVTVNVLVIDASSWRVCLWILKLAISSVVLLLLLHKVYQFVVMENHTQAIMCVSLNENLFCVAKVFPFRKFDTMYCM